VGSAGAERRVYAAVRVFDGPLLRGRGPGRPGEAAAEFQRILEHRSIVLVDPMDAMARLQLARALARPAARRKAKSAYQRLFDVWTSADSESPLLTEAQAEYGRLR
jgi:hypothetical protein